MLEQTFNMNSGTRAFTIAMIGQEFVPIIYDSRWLLGVILLCVVADFRFGWGESHKRYMIAKNENDRIAMAQWKWRTSRAIRRTINKLIDYLMWVSIGVFIGLALLQPIGIQYMMGGWAATFIAVFCEGKSFVGHFLWLHGINIKKTSIKAFLKAFAVSFAKSKNPEIGEAIEDGFEKINGKEKL
ncbi:hypothetical protein [Prevotella sp. HCN-7019]|uniref:hypothetical protein n=1 Tax=Prevotella sp. HCN-7019 TaxID=3134668 RepID=UPI0030C50B10